MKKYRLTELLISVVGAELVGALSALIAGGDFGTYYASLEKPPLSPPAWLFPVAWGIIYALMGLSAYIICLSDSDKRDRAFKLYASQLLVNFLWAPMFFGLKSFGGGVVVIAALTALVAAMVWEFWKIRKKAAILVFPYLLWCLYATYLTIGIFILNK